MFDDAIELSIPASLENFEEESYLNSNLDVKAAVQRGAFGSGLEHFQMTGQRENRKLWVNRDQVKAWRATKIMKLSPFLRDDMVCIYRDGVLDYLTNELRAATRIIDTSNVSSNGYDSDTLALISKYKSGLILDCGAGRRDQYRHNVVNYEIVGYDSTDVIGVGEALPFKDNTFDAVLSIAVLEHVRDPFLCAREIARVLKPGGELFCSVPFLQPLHGYPHHYFNATKQGILRLFEDELAVERIYIPPVGHPAYALHWFLHSWTLGLNGDALTDFRDLRIGDIIDAGPATLTARAGGQLPSAQQDELACSFVLRAAKPI